MTIRRCRVEFEGHGAFEVDEGTNLLDLCDDEGVPMESACGGFAACNSCRVRVLRGMDNLSELDPEERPFLDRDDQRLGCQVEVRGDVVVRLDPGL